MQQVRELGRDRVAVHLGEQRPGLEVGHLRVALHRRLVEVVDLPDRIRRPLLRLRAREDLAEHDRHPRVVPLQRGQDQLQVRSHDLRRRAFLEVVRADQDHHGARIEREHVVLEPEQHAARRVAADPAVGDLDAGKGRAEAAAPALGDRVAEEDHRSAVLGRGLRPRGAPLAPEVAEPVVAADRTLTGQSVIGGGDREAIGGRRGRLCARDGNQSEDQQTGESGSEQAAHHGREHTAACKLAAWTSSTSPPPELRRLGELATELVAEHRAGLLERPVFGKLGEAAAAFDEPLPERGQPVEEVLRAVRERVLPFAFGNSHRASSPSSMRPPTPVGVVGDYLAAAMNSNCWGGDHAAIHVEKRVVAWPAGAPRAVQREGISQRIMPALANCGLVASVTGCDGSRRRAAASPAPRLRSSGYASDFAGTAPLVPRLERGPQLRRQGGRPSRAAAQQMRPTADRRALPDARRPAAPGDRGGPPRGRPRWRSSPRAHGGHRAVDRRPLRSRPGRPARRSPRSAPAEGLWAFHVVGVAFGGRGLLSTAGVYAPPRTR